MPISNLFEDAASQLEETSRLIELSRKKRLYARTLAAIARAHDESIQEKVHRLAGHVHPAGFAQAAHREG